MEDVVNPPESARVFEAQTFNPEKGGNASTKLIEETALRLLVVPEKWKKEMRRLLCANSFRSGGHLVAPFEAFYSVGRCLFGLSMKVKDTDWPLVNQAIQKNPGVILRILDCPIITMIRQGNFIRYDAEGFHPGFAEDPGALARAVMMFQNHPQGFKQK